MTGKRNAGRKPGSLNKGHVGLAESERTAILIFQSNNNCSYRKLAEAIGITRDKLVDVMLYHAGMKPEVKTALLEYCRRG